VTVADFASQAVVCHAIGEVFASDPIIAEEDSQALHEPENAGFLSDIHTLIEQHYRKASKDQICHWIDRGGAKDYSTRFWTLDPIDGTKGFLRKGQYAISLALIINGQIELGVLGCPNLGTQNRAGNSLFYAIRGYGAFAIRPDQAEAAVSIQTTRTGDSKQARFCESVESGHSSHNDSAQIAERLGITLEPIRMDSQAKYATVASGDADVYLRLPTKTGYFEKIWDHAGGVLIVQEAGGTVTDVSGKPLDFSQGRELARNRGVIATNGALHDAVVAATQAVMGAKSEL
jgi:3'(2'), 5'-bisphosphate nucleotidase